MKALLLCAGNSPYCRAFRYCSYNKVPDNHQEIRYYANSDTYHGRKGVCPQRAFPALRFRHHRYGQSTTMKIDLLRNRHSGADFLHNDELHQFCLLCSEILAPLRCLQIPFDPCVLQIDLDPRYKHRNSSTALRHFLNRDRIEERHLRTELLADDLDRVLGFGIAEGHELFAAGVLVGEESFRKRSVLNFR